MHIEIVDEGPEPGSPAIGLAGAAVPSLDSYLSALEPEPPKPISSGSPNLLALQAAEGAPQGAAREPASLVKRSLALAKKLQLQDRPGDAIQALEQGVRSDPDAAEAFPAWLLLGQLRMTNPAWSTRAVEALQQASRINPKAAEPWAVMGEIYHRKGFKANARGCFKKAIELDPSVAVPSDFSMEDRPAEPEEKGPGGVFERLKGLMRR
jgi:tetratricopeptide (TPR) repeat protein